MNIQTPQYGGENETDLEWSHIFEHSGWGIAISRAAYTTLDLMNPAFAAMHGWEIAALTGLPFEQVFAPASRLLLPDHLRRADETGHCTFEAVHIRRDGATFPVLLEISTVRDNHGNISYRVINAQDITTQKQTETVLRLSEERFELAVQGANDGLWDRPNMNSDQEWWSPRYFELLGYQPGEIPSTRNQFFEFLHPEDMPHTEAAMQAHLENHLPYDIRYRLRTKSGAYRWFRARGQAIWAENDQPVRMAGSIQDITHQKEAEETWRRYEFIVNTSGEMMTLIDRSHHFAAVSQAYCLAHQQAQAQIVGQHVATVWGDEVYSAQILARLDRCFGGDDINYQEWVEFSALGRRYVNVVYRPYRDVAGHVTHVVVVTRDITGYKQAQDTLEKTVHQIQAAYNRMRYYAQELNAEVVERKKAEMALQRAVVQNRQLLTAIPSILIGLDPQERVTHWNGPATRTFNLSQTEAVGRALADCGLTWDWPKVAHGLTACQKKNVPIRLHEVHYTRSNGKEGFLNLTVNPFISNSAGQRGILVLGQDVTEQRLLQAQLTQAQKLEAIGQLAAGIAHEINSPAQFIADNINFVQTSFEKLHRIFAQYRHFFDAAKNAPDLSPLAAQVEAAISPARPDYLLAEIPMAVADALEGINRVAAIVTAMKTFSHPGVSEKIPVDINKAIQSTITIARHEWKYVARLQTDFDPHLLSVPCLPGEFNQAMLNIIVNAAHAIAQVAGSHPDEKGLITIATRQVGPWVEIQISDTGAGIPDSIKTKIFDPFFTTKEVGRGTGQGLSIAHAVIVDKHQGTIGFDTQIGHGTTFTIRLPLEVAAAPSLEIEALNDHQD